MIQANQNKLHNNWQLSVLTVWTKVVTAQSRFITIIIIIIYYLFPKITSGYSWLISYIQILLVLMFQLWPDAVSCVNLAWSRFLHKLSQMQKRKDLP